MPQRPNAPTGAQGAPPDWNLRPCSRSEGRPLDFGHFGAVRETPQILASKSAHAVPDVQFDGPDNPEGPATSPDWEKLMDLQNFCE